MDLISLVLSLRPASSPERGETAPAWWGRAAHALLLHVIQQADKGLASTLHETNGPKPFTASSLLGRFPDRRLDPEGTYTLRLTGLDSRVSPLLWQATQPRGPLAPGAQIELDYHRFTIEGVVDQGHPWAGQTSYAEVAASSLAGGPAPTRPIHRRLSLQLTSPTTFKSRGRHLPVPLPELVFGSLLDRWNTFAAVAFPEEARRYAEECLAITRYHLRTRSVPVKGGGLRMGAVGQVTYTTLNYDRYWMGVLAALAEYATYSGIGAGTAMGLGQARWLRDEGP